MRKLCIVFIVIIGCVQPFDMKSCFGSDEEEEGRGQQSNLVDVNFPAGPEKLAGLGDQIRSSESGDDSKYAPLQDQEAVGVIRPADIGGCMACICCFFDCLGDLMKVIR